MRSNQNNIYIIDTNIYGLALREHNSQVRSFLSSLKTEEVYVSCFVLAELSVLKYSFFHPMLHALMESISNSKVLWFDNNDSKVFSILKYKMQLQGYKNRTIDWFIASQCLTKNCVLVTANIKDYESIPSLKVKFYDQKNSRWIN
jgi:tRNA(fMet)-specific endonuclease VapC